MLYKTKSIRYKSKMKEDTLANKLTAIVLLIVGMVPIFLFKDGTVMLLFSFFAVPLLFAKENWMQY